MSHNSTGYREWMNPEMIDGIEDPRDHSPDAWPRSSAARALRAEAIVKGFDPERIVYHHSSGNLGSMHTANFYPNFTPVQELDDWFEHWATVGVKPVFLCEYTAPMSPGTSPCTAAGTRAWRTYGNAVVPWELCMAEWNSQFLRGRRLSAISELEKEGLRWESAKFRAGELWHRWDYPVPLGRQAYTEQYPAMAMYVTDNWRAFRTWGLSANTAFDAVSYWKLRDGVDKSRKELKVDWDQIQRPGFSPDYIDGRYETMETAFERSDWAPTVAGQALLRNNMPLLAYIAGKPEAFTSKDHNFFPGETVDEAADHHQQLARPGDVRCRVVAGLARRAHRRKQRLRGDRRPGTHPAELRASGRPGARPVRVEARRSISGPARPRRIPSRSTSCRARSLRRSAARSPCSTRRARPASCSTQ